MSLKASNSCSEFAQGPHVVRSFDPSLHALQAQLTGGVSPVALSLAFSDWLQHLALSPDKQTDLWIDAGEKWARFVEYAVGAFCKSCAEHCIEPTSQDKRFSNVAWELWPFNAIFQGFLLTQQWWQQATTDVSGVSRHHEAVVNFVTRQLLDMASPANFILTNPEVLAATFQECGRNLNRGMMNYWDDVMRSLTHQRPFGHDIFRVGETVAATPGKVIFKNRLIELIQYAPTTDRVHLEPVLIIPAWIMKYYILDLSPENSLVRYLVDRGHTVFVVSWKNPEKDDRALSLDDYRRLGILAALEAVITITSHQKVHSVGYCLGGTLLAVTAAAMARENDDRIATMTLLTAQVDFTEAGDLMLFIDDSQVAFLEDLMELQGYLNTRQMANAFQLLRSNDLIWSKVIQGYLLGRRPEIFDLMAWNSDGTRLPAKMHSDYLRDFFLKNDFADNRYLVDGRPVSLGDIRIPIFCVGTETDHVAPWKSVYKIQSLTNGDVTFVLSNGGHNAAIVNPPGNNKRRHQIATHDDLEKYVDPDTWREQATNHTGSWWPCWQKWLTDHSSGLCKPPAIGASRRGYQPLADAPGSYVLSN